MKNKIKLAYSYVDDILLFLNSYEEHGKHLQKTCNICHEESLCKFSFGTHGVESLGYEFEHGKVRPDNSNIETINKLKPPKYVQELQRVFGTVKFIPQHAKFKIILTDLLKENATWQGTDKFHQQFKKLKSALISKTMLHLCNSKFEFLYSLTLQQKTNNKISLPIKTVIFYCILLLYYYIFHIQKTLKI